VKRLAASVVCALDGTDGVPTFDTVATATAALDPARRHRPTNPRVWLASPKMFRSRTSCR
jgi:hypothetical protein